MKTPVQLTRRRLGAALALPFAAAAGKTGQPAQARARPPARVRAAAAKVAGARPGKNISPAFRFIP